MIIQHLQMKIVVTLVLVIRKLQGCVVLNEWLSSVQDSNQDQDHREIYRQGKITLTDKGCLERVVHLPCGIRSGYKIQGSIGQLMLLSLVSSVNYDKNKMQNSIGLPMLLCLLSNGRYDKNKIENSTGQPMLLSLPTNLCYDKNKMLLR